MANKETSGKSEARGKTKSFLPERQKAEPSGKVREKSGKTGKAKVIKRYVVAGAVERVRPSPSALETYLRASARRYSRSKMVAEIEKAGKAVVTEISLMPVAEWGAAPKEALASNPAEEAQGMDFEAIASDFDMSRAALAQSLGLPPKTFYEPEAEDEPVVARRVEQFLAIIARVEPWAGDTKKAIAWYRDEPIPALGRKTAEDLVRADKGAMVSAYLDVYESGGFA